MEMSIDCLAREFMSAGHEVMVLAQRPRKAFDKPDLPYDVVYYRRVRSARWLLGPAKRALLREHARRRFDVINVHMTYPNGYIAVKLRDRLGVPVVIKSPGGDVRPQCRYLNRRVTRQRTIWTLANADAVAALSEPPVRRIDLLTAGKANSCVICQGVNLDPQVSTAVPERLAYLADKPFMLALGRLHPIKGLDVLLDAMARIGEKTGHTPHLVVVGEGKSREELLEQTRRLGLTEAVSFVGLAFGADKHWLFGNCRLFVLPSRNEGGPRTVLEAMAHGKPVVATDVGAVRRFLTDADESSGQPAGVVVPVDDCESLAEAIGRVWDDPAGLREMSASASIRVREFSWAGIAEQFMQLFQVSIDRCQ